MKALRPADKMLFLAIESGDVDNAEKALDLGADVDARKRYRTPLLDAVLRDDVAMAKLLVSRGAPIAMVKNSREPLGAAIWKCDGSMLAALLQTDPTDACLARALADGLATHTLGPSSEEVGRCLLTQRWHSVFCSMMEQGLLTRQSFPTWWARAAYGSSPCEQSIEKLHQAAPITETTNQQSILRGVLKGQPNLPFLTFLARVGWLTSKELFDTPFDDDKGLLVPLVKRHYCAMPLLRWLLKHAGDQPDGREKLLAVQGNLFPLCLGSRASWPLADLFCKLTSTDPLQVALCARDESGRSTLHFLLDAYGDRNRRLGIAKTLLQAGMDPMTLDNKNVPACYGVLFYEDATEKAFDLMDEFGADLTLHGPVGQALEKDPLRHIRWQAQAAQALTQFSVKKTHRDLQSVTPEITYTACVRRI